MQLNTAKISYQFSALRVTCDCVQYKSRQFSTKLKGDNLLIVINDSSKKTL
jgi:hypothetical protein